MHRKHESNESYYVHILHTFFFMLKRSPSLCVLYSIFIPFTSTFVKLKLSLLSFQYQRYLCTIHLLLCQTFTMRCLTSIYFHVFCHIFSTFVWCCYCCFCCLVFTSLPVNFFHPFFIYVLCFRYEFCSDLVLPS